MSLMFQLNRCIRAPAMAFTAIMDIYNHEVLDGDIGNESYMANPQGVCDAVSPGRVRFLGAREVSYRCGGDEFEIQRWYNPRTDFHHFVAGADNRVIYDPIEGGSVTVREGKMDSKRIFQLV